jgi:hypothetical protein
MALPSLPKLAAWKTNDNAKSISVLGQNEIQLTNISIVAERYLLLASNSKSRLGRGSIRFSGSGAVPGES